MAPGLFTTIQDFGRFGHQALGIPVCGALDPVGLRLANALVGNAGDAGALEIRIAGPTMRVETESARIALAGTTAVIEVLGKRPLRIASGRSLRLKDGDVFRIGAVADTSCCYLAVEGGFDVAAPFGSQSTYVRGGFGGFEGRPLKDGDRLPLAAPQVSDRPDLALAAEPALDAPGPIRVVLGPQDNYFTEGGIATLLESEFTISPNADRMGLRLDGPVLEHALGYNIASDGIATGSIQVPGTGKPIVLLADHQTTGGYPKIATVISADLPRLGRMRPGHKLRFAAVSVTDAEAVRRAQEAVVRRWLADLVAVGAPGHADTGRLLVTNLISGVVGPEE